VADSRWRRLIVPVLLAAAFLAAACLLRVPGFDMPLNRDESAYAMIGDQGSLHLLPYRDFFDNKQPLIYVVYWALAQVAPQSTGAVRLAAALSGGMAALVLLALLVPRIGTARALAAAVTALVAGATTYVEGYDLNAEHLLIVTATLTILVALSLGDSPHRRAPLLVGLFGGVAVLTKAVFALGALAALVPLLAGRRARGQSAAATIAWLALGFAIPPLVVFAAFALAGAGDAFWQGNIGWNEHYVASGASRLSLRSAVAPVGALAALALAFGAARLVLQRGRDVLGLTLLVWLVAAFAGAKLSGRDFPHYFAPVIPPAAALLWLPWPRVPRAVPVAAAVLAVAVAIPFARDAVRGFGDSGAELSARQYGAGFADVWNRQFEVGELLRSRARPGDRLFVAGAEPGFNWASGLPPASPHFFLYDYPDVEADWSAEIHRLLCDHPPRFVITVWSPLESGCTPPGRYRRLFAHDVPGGRLVVMELAQPR